MKYLLCILALLCVQSEWSYAELFTNRRAEADFVYSGLTNGFETWRDYNARNYFAFGDSNQFMIETDYKNHFGEGAGVFGLNLTHNYNEDWYQDFSVTYGTNTAVLAELALFTELHRKVLPDKNLVLGLGVGYIRNADPYRDTFAIVDLSYYLNSMFSFQVLLRGNQSNPNAVNTFRTILVANFVYEQKVEAFVRFETGTEGYSVVGLNSFRNEFHSTGESAQIRYWWTEKFGSSIFAEFYQNPFYVRNSVGVGLMLSY